MNKFNIKQIFLLKKTGDDVEVEGWVRTKRDAKGFCFCEVNDGSTINNLQVIIKDSLFKDQSITTGCSIYTCGKLVESPGKGQKIELNAETFIVTGECPSEDYPLQKKRHSFEFLREIAHLRPRTNTFGAVCRIRNAMSMAIHDFFQKRDFLYIHTPIISSSDCEGAGEMFQVTTISFDNIPKDEKGLVDYTADFFGQKTGLTVSGQLQAEAYASALKNVYTFGPTFRAEHSNTTRHLSEFWMIEPEMAFCDLNLNMDVAEEFLKNIFIDLFKNCKDDIDFFNERVDKNVISSLEKIIENPFIRITYTEAVTELKKSKKAFEYPVTWGVNLQAEHERYLTEVVYNNPVIVTDYPKEIKAFYMKLNNDEKTVRAMDILVPRLGEIIGGSQREENYGKLLNRIKELNLSHSDYWWYLDLRRFGTVVHSGFGLGFERLIQYVTGMQNIRDVIPFPRTFKSIDF